MASWDYYKVLAYVSSFSVLIPLLSIFKKRNYTSTCWFLFAYLVISFVTEVILLIIAKSGRSNLSFLQFFKLAELILIIEIFKTSGLFVRKYNWRLNIISIVGLAFFVVGFIVDWTGLFDGFEHTCIIFICIISFYKLFLINEPDSLNINPFFWLNLAFFIYFSAAFFLFLFGNLIRNFEEIAKLLWTIHLLANMVFYYILTLGIWKIKAS